MTTKANQMSNSISEVEFAEIIGSAMAKAAESLSAALSNISFPKFDSFSIPFLVGKLPMDSEPKKGFVLINGNTWLPRPLHDDRLKQQRKIARKNENYVIWTK